jgi:hypothetical protein
MAVIKPVLYKPKTILTIGQAGVLLGVESWKIRKLIYDGKLAEAQRVGTCRVFLAEDLVRIKRALREAGYL